MSEAPLDLDRVDHAILEILQQDGRRANVDLADAVHLSPSACLRRIRRLEEAGVIDRYAALLDPSRVGLGTDVFVEITLAGQDEVTLDAFEVADENALDGWRRALGELSLSYQPATDRRPPVHALRRRRTRDGKGAAPTPQTVETVDAVDAARA